jgi:hypothetical protein
MRATAPARRHEAPPQAHHFARRLRACALAKGCAPGARGREGRAGALFGRVRRRNSPRMDQIAQAPGDRASQARSRRDRRDRAPGGQTPGRRPARDGNEPATEGLSAESGGMEPIHHSLSETGNPRAAPTDRTNLYDANARLGEAYSAYAIGRSHSSGRVGLVCSLLDRSKQDE